MSSVKMGQPPSGRARSSRRTLGTGAPVVLGGGAGVLGAAHGHTHAPQAGTSIHTHAPQAGTSIHTHAPQAGTSRPKQAPSPTFVTAPTAPGVASRSPATSYFPVQVHSPTSPSFDMPSPVMPPALAPSHAHPQALAPHPIPSHAVATATARPPVPISKHTSQSGESTNSLSTAASSSSRTLKTPASKPGTNNIVIIDGSDSLDGHAPYGYSDQTSPTPARVMELPRKAGERLRLPLAPPALAQGPLPPAPTASGPSLSSPKVGQFPSPVGQSFPPTGQPSTRTGHAAGVKQTPRFRERDPLSLETNPRSRDAKPRSQHNKKEARLSQDWVQVSAPSRGPVALSQQDAGRMRSESPISKPTVAPVRLPPVSMVPMKGDSLSPPRPKYERTVSAPPLSPTGGDKARSQRAARSSLDQLRNSSPSPDPFRSRQTSMSTPPQAILDAGTSSASGGRLNVWRTAPPKQTMPELRTRRSGDLLRPGRPSLDALSKKELKAAQKDAQRNLGVASTAFMYTPPNQSEERKTSGLSLKKSSGALKALFRSNKGKEMERSNTPPVPVRPARPSTAPSYEMPRPSFTLGRPVTPGSPTSSHTLPLDIGGATTAATGDRSMSSGRSSMSSERPMEGARTNSSFERLLFPKVPGHTPPPAMRVASQGRQAVTVAPAPASRVRTSSRDLPPLPPPSPVPPVSLDTLPSPLHVMARPASPLTPPKFSLLADALPASSLPYLDPRASLVIDDNTTIRVSASETVTTSAAASSESLSSDPSYASTARPEPEGTSPYLKASRSLHLLQLPELDLDFGLTFDSLGLGISPSTPRRSPNSPARSNTTIHPRTSPSPKSVSRAATITERRRSRSFDGLDDFWRGDRITGQPSSSSAPILLSPIEPQPSSVESQSVPMGAGSSGHSHSQSVSSTAPSSSDHARTPSNASSTNDTPSPSPPHTPTGTEHRSLHGFGFASGSPSTLPIPTTANAANGVEDPMTDSLIGGKPFVLNVPPTIPLPALPSSSAAPLPSFAISALEPPALIASMVPTPAPTSAERTSQPSTYSAQRLLVKSKPVIPELSLSNKTLGLEIERLHYSYPHCATFIRRADLIRNDLLPLLAEIDRRPLMVADEGNAALREACFRWAELMLVELREEQAAVERGSCLEALAAAMESSCLSAEALQESERHREKFEALMMECMTFVMGKLGAKGVFHNTLLFSGRFFAFAFFRVPHVGEQLVTVLQPPRGALMRFTRSSLVEDHIPDEAQPTFPSHLLALCFDDSRTYTSRLASLTADFATADQREAFLFQPGNWVRRWQSDDSELFPAFYRAYHRQLAAYLAPAIKHYEALGKPLPANLLLRAPGYAHLATIFAKKCHSYILGSVNAVTTSSSAQYFEATETAGFRCSQKPAVLETANRRLVETLSTLSTLHVNILDGGTIVEVEGQQLYSSMLDLWAKSAIAKTSLYASKGVFCLFDLLDGIVDPPSDATSGERNLKAPSLLDVPHLIHVVRLILTQGEHALTLVKVIAFVFTHWEVLTARAEDRRELCQELLLQQELFERLLLFWSQSVRSYILRLVVFRLSHLHTTKEDGEAHAVEIDSVRLLQTRLDRIKKRHDELEPASLAEAAEAIVPPTHSEGSDGLPRSRSTITMVADSPRLGPSNKAERLLGLGFGQQETQGEIEVDAASASKVGKATNWLKKSFGGAAKKRRKDGTIGESPSPNLESSPILRGTPQLLGTSPALRNASPSIKQPSPIPNIFNEPSPISPHSEDATGSASPTGANAGMSNRRPRPPKISTTSPSATSGSPSSPSAFAFEFELPTMSPRSDHFDAGPTQLPGSSPRANPSSQPQPPSPHMSRSFSKRSSLLPPSTATALAQETAQSGDKLRYEAAQKEKQEAERETGYDKRLHAYAIRMFAELENAQKEYDEWWAEGGVGKVGGCPPRLTVAWPFHEGDD